MRNSHRSSVGNTGLERSPVTITFVRIGQGLSSPSRRLPEGRTGTALWPLT
jgi:hypothetical protein